MSRSEIPALAIKYSPASRVIPFPKVANRLFIHDKSSRSETLGHSNDGINSMISLRGKANPSVVFFAFSDCLGLFLAALNPVSEGKMPVKTINDVG